MANLKTEYQITAEDLLLPTPRGGAVTRWVFVQNANHVPTVARAGDCGIDMSKYAEPLFIVHDLESLVITTLGEENR